MHRRALLRTGASLPVLVIAGTSAAAPAPASQPDAPVGPVPFDAATVRNLARQLAQSPYKPPQSDLPDALAKLDYETYRGIRFDSGHALWRGQDRRFTVQFFHRGFIYKDRVDIHEVADGKATKLRYDPDWFTFDKGQLPPGDLGFAGFRLHYPLNRPDYGDEICAFLGASYFRAVAKGQGYGLSARGLAIKTADAGGEEFPVFKAFWLERPAAGADLMVVRALLDSPSATAAFRFTIRPGEDTVFDTETALFPRADIAQAGVAPLTSMYLFAPNDRAGFDDWRPAVHDSLGLSLRTGRDERLWRPLANPRELQVSAFSDASPRGFGLMQRQRAFADFQDLESRYERRPSAWIEPIGDWSEGAVHLVEIPSDREINDNIVAFWRPKEALRAKGEYLLNYRLHWCWSEPGGVPLATVGQTRCGLSWDQKNRQFVIDFIGDVLKPFTPEKPPALDIGCDKGQIVHANVQTNPDYGGWRVSIQHDPQGNKVVELHARLLDGEKPVSETWVYRWTPS